MKNNQIKETGKCCLCGGQYKMYGCNPDPLRMRGSCCHDCDTSKVIPARRILAGMNERAADVFAGVLRSIVSGRCTSQLQITRQGDGILITAR